MKFQNINYKIGCISIMLLAGAIGYEICFNEGILLWSNSRSSFTLILTSYGSPTEHIEENIPEYRQINDYLGRPRIWWPELLDIAPELQISTVDKRFWITEHASVLLSGGNFWCPIPFGGEAILNSKEKSYFERLEANLRVRNISNE